MVALLRAEVDEGEAEAVALARERQIPVVLLDERDARRVAQRLSLQVLGTVGILVWARRVGTVVSLRDQLDSLQSRGRFHLSESVCQEALRAVGEAE